MPQKIITLSQELANQIAAGEVVERPVSVVKELLENAIDAGATSIDIEVKNGGIDQIIMRDNGSGIASEDLSKALEKYSTSKITDLKDLQEVMTFGFRGEALASISSISQFTLKSSTDNTGAGEQIEYRDGKLSKNIKISHEKGTSIMVENIFYNTPARLNYLKTPRTEYLKIQECVQKFALIYPNRELSLIHDDRQTQHFPKNQTLKERIYSIYGQEFAENLLDLKHSFGGIQIQGVISDPKISFHNKSRQVIFVNNRIISSPIITKAISDAYNRYIAPKSFPGYVLHIQVDPTEVDVNVHPRKLEVRFASEQNLFRSVYHGVQNLLESVSLVKSSHNTSIQLSPVRGKSELQCEQENGSFISPGRRELREVLGGDGVQKKSPQYHNSSGTKFKNYSPYTDTTPNPAQNALSFTKTILGNNLQPHFSGKDKGENECSDYLEVKASQKIEGVESERENGEEFKENTGDLIQTPLGKILGQAHNAYILIETENGIQMLDQHALAERVIYEKLQKSSYTPQSQQILGGEVMMLTSSEQEICENFGEVFQNMGFDIEILSHSMISIGAIPDFVGKQNISQIFRSILADISTEGSKNLDEVRHKIWAYTACRSAVKFGDPLTIFEMHALLRDANLDYSATCPHGRPVVYEIDLNDLQKKYER